MILSAELSLYPLADAYIPPIDDFIGALSGVEGLVTAHLVAFDTVTGLPSRRLLVIAMAQGIEE